MIPANKFPFPSPPAPAASIGFTFRAPYPTPASDERGVIYTFYSFKGGVGRSMALANVAALLAKWGYSVLVVDWDVEAPGIERFFARDNPGLQDLRANTPGVLDLVQAKSDGNPLPWRDCLIDVKIGSSCYAETRARLLRPATGAKPISRRDPVACANRSRVRIDGRTLPLSRRATTGWVVPIFRANCCWVRPARFRASMTAAASANSSSSAS